MYILCGQLSHTQAAWACVVVEIGPKRMSACPSFHLRTETFPVYETLCRRNTKDFQIKNLQTCFQKPKGLMPGVRGAIKRKSLQMWTQSTLTVTCRRQIVCTRFKFLSCQVGSLMQWRNVRCFCGSPNSRIFPVTAAGWTQWQVFMPSAFLMWCHVSLAVNAGFDLVPITDICVFARWGHSNKVNPLQHEMRLDDVQTGERIPTVACTDCGKPRKSES